MSTARILVVDDNPTNKKLLAYLLSSFGYEVQTADSAQGALATLEDSLPDLILLDVQMPGMDGLQLTRLLKADPRTRNIVIIAVSAYAMRGDEEKAIDAGCDAYVTKPIDTRTLPTLVARHLGGRGSNSSSLT